MRLPSTGFFQMDVRDRFVRAKGSPAADPHSQGKKPRRSCAAVLSRLDSGDARSAGSLEQLHWLEPMVRASSHTFSRYDSPPSRGEVSELLKRIFVTTFGMNRLSLIEVYDAALAGDEYFLLFPADKMHLHAPQTRIVKGVVAE